MYLPVACVAKAAYEFQKLFGAQLAIVFDVWNRVASLDCVDCSIQYLNDRIISLAFAGCIKRKGIC